MRWLLVIMIAGCTPPAARPVDARYPAAAPAQETSTLVIQFTGEVQGAHLAVNGRSIAAGARTSRITVAGVPSGDVAVMLAAEGGVEKAFGVHLEPGQELVVPVSTPAPPPKGAHPVLQAVLTLFVYLTYTAVSSRL